MKNKIAPSMMCADPMRLRETLASFALCGVEYLHIDVMDGHFVPNFTLGTDYCRKLKENTRIPLDLHLMVEEPESKLDWFPISAGDVVSVHVESTRHLQRTLAAIRERGGKAFAALNPATPVSALEYVTEDLDGVLVMTVNPGFAGQKLIPQTLCKIRALRDILDAGGHSEAEIEVDGNVSFEHAPRMRKAGANIFVGGSSSVFAAGETLEDSIRKLRALLG